MDKCRLLRLPPGTASDARTERRTQDALVTMEKKSQKCRLLYLLSALVLLLGEVSSKSLQAGGYQSTEHSEDEEIVDELHSFLPVQDPSTQHPSKVDLCATIFCGNGRECVLEAGKPTCGCALSCPDHYNVICGSDGVTYGNPCKLHRAACLQNIKIHKHMLGPCPAPPPTVEPPPEEERPLVCYEIERDQLRQLLIDWMKGRVHEDNDENPEDSYAQVLTANFRECDLDGDDKLSGSEFIECVEKNETVADFAGEGSENGHVLRGLCVDALILMSDRDEDWMLDLEEFLRCMDPNFRPPRKQCSLENRLYEDGAETRVDCNICVCACGNWVCSAMSCDDIDEYNLFEPYDVEQGPLPSREERYALLRGFRAAEHVNLDRVDEEVPVPDHNGPGSRLFGGFPPQGAEIPGSLPGELPAGSPEGPPHMTGEGQGSHDGGNHDEGGHDEGGHDEGGHDEGGHDETQGGHHGGANGGETRREHGGGGEHDVAPPTQDSLLPPGEDTASPDGPHALDEYLSIGGASAESEATAEQVEQVEQVEQEEQEEQEGIVPASEGVPDESVPPTPTHSAEPLTDELLREEKEEEEEEAQGEQVEATTPKVTPHPTPAQRPVRRNFIPFTFNITMAEHRIIHTGDGRRRGESDGIRFKAQHIPHHGGHHQDSERRQHSGRHHNSHHSNHHNHHNHHHSNHPHQDGHHQRAEDSQHPRDLAPPRA